MLAGAVNVTVACALPAVAVPIVGAPGTVAGVTLFDAADGALVPTALVAVTVHVTAAPFVSPGTVMGDVAPDALCVSHVAVYEVIAEPPLLAGAVKVTVACALPAVAVPIVGAPGTVAGVTVLDADDEGPVPTALVAVTLQDTGVPFVSPATVIGELAPDALCVPQVAV